MNIDTDKKKGRGLSPRVRLRFGSREVVKEAGGKPGTWGFPKATISDFKEWTTVKRFSEKRLQN